MPKLTFLGGADEVGASCTLVEIAGKRILVDCGIRMSPRDGDVLPYLAPIEEAGGLDAIILTHAHTDHSGAMPVIHQSYSHVPVYMTAATLSLTTILLMDSLKIMQSEFEKEGEIPLYPLPAVELLIGASRPVAMCTPLDIFGGDIRLTFTPAGHILGAATVLIESDDGVILMGGDVSVTDQLTIPGMMRPPCTQPDIVVIESTYGGRKHADRSAEEHRLVERANEVIQRGGGILFPAFAVGRAQEVILILSRAMERGHIPKAPIFVDGMVRTVCSAYRSYPELLTPWLRKRIDTKGDPFYPADGTVEPVFKPQLREHCANQRPAIYIASSGMLTGGPSPYYATKLAPNPKNCIAITGYQDEESPGRRVQDVARAGGGMLRLHEQDVELKCEVGTYGLSAHADTSQLVDALRDIAPHQIALVHGDHGAREALEDALCHARLNGVHRPTIGSTLEITPHKRRSFRLHSAAPAEEKRFESFHGDVLLPLAQTLLERDGAGRHYTVPEILFAWGMQGELYQQDIERASAMLQSKESPFKRDKKRVFLYRLRVNSQGQLSTREDKAIRKQARKGNHQPVLQRIAELFPPETGVYKRKVQLNGPDIVLFFEFPDVQPHHPDIQHAIQLFTEETNWGIKIHPQPHQQRLSEKAAELLPDDCQLAKRPAIHLDQQSVTITLSTPLDTTHAQTIQDDFKQQTGFALQFKEVAQGQQPILPVNMSSPNTPQLEINQAYQCIRDAFQDTPHELLKCGQKQDQDGPYIELSFISPQIGRLYLDTCTQLQQQTGYRIRIKPTPDQHRIKQLAAALIPASWNAKKGPGFHEQEGYLSIKATTPPSDEEREAISQALAAQTGYTLRVK